MNLSLRLLLALGLALSAMACDDGATPESDPLPVDPEPTPEPTPEPEPPSFCAGATAQRYAPFESAEMESYPDDVVTVDDASSPTGLRLNMDPETVPWVEAMPRLFADSVVELTGQTGWATNGPIFMRFTEAVGPVPTTAEASLTDAGLMLLDLSTEPPTRVPYTARLSEGDRAVFVQPLRPMTRGARHALVMTTAQPAADGDCIAPSENLQAILTDTAMDPRLARMSPIYAEVLAATGLTAVEISAATVFTPHDEHQVMIAVAEDIAGQSFRWSTPPACTATERWRTCEGAFEATDYRDDRAILTPAAIDKWTLPVSIWMPLEADGPLPTLFVGHGLGSGRFQAERLADLWVEDGYIVVAMDALQHGEHPTWAGNPVESADSALAFLGLNLAAFKADGRAMTGNFNQTVADRLQGLQLLRQNPDVDGDGAADINVDKIAYYGVSLGGMLGVGLSALDAELELSILQVPGGLLSEFVIGNPELEAFMPVLVNLIGSEERFERMLPILQTAIDPADPATFAPFLTEGRLVDAPPLNLLVAVSAFDEVVPPRTGSALARSMGLQHVGPAVFDVELLDAVAAPAVNNVSGGAATAGYFQFDRVTNEGRVEESRHGNTPLCDEAQYQARAFVEPWLEGAPAQIVDPYPALGTPTLD